MKSHWVIIGIIVFILVALLIGVGKSWSTPAEIITKKPVKVLEYQQQGVFDFEVTAKPAYFYDNSPTAAPETSSQIPVKFIESFALDYFYVSKTGTAGESIKINAILENPGAWKKTINLVPEKIVSANISFLLDLKYFQDLGDSIGKEISLSASSYDLTVQATISGGTGPDFVQVLPIKMSKTFIRISDNLTSNSGGREGKFDYRVKLADNILFGPVTLTPPSRVNTPGTVLGSKDTVFTKFIDSMKINYNYRLTSTKAVIQLQEEVIIEAILENPEKWSKYYTLVPPIRQNGDVNLSFPLDLKQFTTIFDTIQQETGITASIQSLTLKATLHTTGKTDEGSIDKTFTQSIKTNLRDGILTWSGDLKKTEPGFIETMQSVKDEAKILGLPVLSLRIFLILLALILLVVLLIYSMPYIMPWYRKPLQTLSQAKQFRQKYKEIIVEVKEWPEDKPGQTIIALESLQDLVKVSQELLKPVHHTTEGNNQIFWVYDDGNRYEYLLADDMSN